MDCEITPKPSEEERAAILAALEAEEDERTQSDPWSEALLPGREGRDEPHP